MSTPSYDLSSSPLTLSPTGSVSSPVTRTRGAVVRERLRCYYLGCKPRITFMVLLTSALGFFLAAGGIKDYLLFAVTMLGTALSCGGSALLNMVIERDADAKMKRTRNRPIPAGLLQPAEALCVGLLLVLSGVVLLAFAVNLLSAFLALLTAFLYVVVYTPLKKLTWLNTVVGAIPGALPPLGGWAAVTNDLPLGAWALFLIVFLWQHPHFYAIAWMYRDDYARGGFKMLPVVDPDGSRTGRQVVFFTVLLLFASMIPVALDMSGQVYFAGALLGGGYFLAVGITLARTRTVAAARRVLRVSVMYLPLLMILIATDLNL